MEVTASRPAARLRWRARRTTCLGAGRASGRLGFGTDPILPAIALPAIALPAIALPAIAVAAIAVAVPPMCVAVLPMRVAGVARRLPRRSQTSR